VHEEPVGVGLHALGVIVELTIGGTNGSVGPVSVMTGADRLEDIGDAWDSVKG